MSEAQRYGGANYVAVQPKGEAKQDAFMQQVHNGACFIRFISSFLTQLNEAIAEALISGKGGKNKVLYERLQQYQNVPRKETKFRNFASTFALITSIETVNHFRIVSELSQRGNHH